VNRPIDLSDVLGEAWPVVLEHLEDAVLVLDSQRILRFVNDPARRLLGYEGDQPVGGRCRFTTRGVDCENACPLTFALEGSIKRVENFATVYHMRDGTPVPLKVTVIPLRDADGEFRGAVEILRPTDPDPGFFLAGRSEAAESLRERLARLAQTEAHLVLVGEEAVCTDVARAVHRFSGVADTLCRSWPGSWDAINPWPPGSVYAYGDGVNDLLGSPPPEGWRVIAGVADLSELPTNDELPYEVIELPVNALLDEDWPFIVSSWLGQLAPDLDVDPRALDRLSRMVRELGFTDLLPILNAAIAVAGGRLEESHFPADGYGTVLVDELLQEADPLAAMEERLLREVLDRSGWRMQEAADRLGISRVTLWRKLRDHGIERPEQCGK